MSHFFTVVILPKALSNKESDMESVIESLLAPYDEHLEVPEYDKDCYCINHKARMETTKKAQEIFGTYDSFRNSYNNLIQSQMAKLGVNMNEYNDEYWDARARLCKEIRWEEHIKDLLGYEDREVKLHPLYNKPDSDCSECNGTGLYKSTYNPKSKHDYWLIGGRYDGIINNDYRSSENGFNFDSRHNQFAPNTALVSDYLALCRNDSSFYPFAIVSPDGKWAEKGDMGWWGIVSNENKNWIKIADEILEQYQEHSIVGCDLHI